MNNTAELWKTVLGLLSEKFSEVTIATWFEDARVVEYSSGRVIITSPFPIKRDIINEKYLDTLTAVWRDIFSEETQVVVMTEGEFREYLKEKENSADFDSGEFTFSNFVVGGSNKFAHAAAIAVSEMPARVYNPLFIHGQSGLGKTHLLYAIAGKIRRDHPDWRISYTTAEDFTNEVIDAIGHGTTPELREKYRKVDLLLVDDVQFLAGKAATQEEFFHTFNALVGARHQIVLTSDRPPKEINKLEDRIRTRFESGLLADILPPDLETRIAIILAKAKFLGIELPNEVVDFFAQKITNNVRQLEGVVKKIKALNAFMNQPFTLETAQTAIEDVFRENPGLNPTPAYIIGVVAEFYNVSAVDITSTKRTQDIMIARQAAIYLTRRITKYSLPEIGAAFGRDHTTVIHSINKIEDLLKTDETLKSNIETLIKTIRRE